MTFWLAAGAAMTGLEKHLRAAFPHLSFRARAILDALLLDGGLISPAGRLSSLVGVTNRFALARMLQKEGLPPLHELAAWIRLLTWITSAEQEPASLFAIATHSGKSPAVCYRTAKRLTGLTWAQLRSRGSRWVLRLFIVRCRAGDRPLPALNRERGRGRSPNQTAVKGWPGRARLPRS